ncbi:MAG: hypothetical protein B0D92_08310 [Spirochaeta sp. LUC14_002_19_P3]|nr:MAG: hypothetical protein B0D92_08310 [Spirochaeta sp. LUC14_002_19_P3]
MKVIFILSFLGIIFSLSAKGMAEGETAAALDVYCYSSFSSEWGPGPAISEAFKEKTGIRVSLHAPGDAVTVLNQLIFEQSSPRADVVVGLDNSLLRRALKADILEAYKPPRLEDIPQALIFDSSYHLLPYDYGVFAINYDSLNIQEPPGTLEELSDERFRDKLVLIDPRTSTAGLGFLLWTAAVYGDAWPDYWRRLRPSILTVAESWSQGYALFAAGEVPLVLSYGTSPVYHAEYEQSDRYRAAEFSEGHLRQIEGMGIVKGTARRAAAEAFIDFMLEPEAQKLLALHNIMLPVNPKVPLPPSFSHAMRPAKELNADAFEAPEAMDALIDTWAKLYRR